MPQKTYKKLTPEQVAGYERDDVLQIFREAPELWLGALVQPRLAVPL